MKSSDILRIERTNRDEWTYIIRWQMTHLCNYYCDFCIQGNREHHISRARGESTQIREKICSHLITFIEKELNSRADVLKLYLVGGEVTILPDFMTILNRLMRAKFRGEMRINITTNVSMSLEMCRRLARIATNSKRRKLSISCSYYKEFMAEEEFIKRIKALSKKSVYQEFLVKYLKRNNIVLTIGYPLCTDQDYAEYLCFRERNVRYASRIKGTVIRDYKTSISQSVQEKLRAQDEEKKKKAFKVTWKDGTVKYFSENVDYSLFVDEEASFQPKGFLCDVGCHLISVDPLGNMSHCATAEEQTVFGNLCDEVPKYMTAAFRCQAKRCACHYFSLIENDL